MPTPLNSSVLRGFEILSLISKSRPEISAALVREQLGLNNATAHRFLMTLEAAGALRATKRGYFALGPKIDELGQISEETGAIGLMIQPELEALSRKTNESVMVSKLTKRGPTCVAVANSSQPISVNITVGTVLPFHASAQGKLWLAETDKKTRRVHLENANVAGSRYSLNDIGKLNLELEDAVKDGFSTNLGDNEPDIAAVAVPVRRSDGKMVLSLSVFGLLRRFDEDRIGAFKKELIAAAKLIGRHFD